MKKIKKSSIIVAISILLILVFLILGGMDDLIDGFKAARNNSL